MKLNYNLILLILLIFLLNINIGCNEKIIYSGKVNNNNFKYETFLDKNQLINNLGKPNYIDIIENKYYYYTKKKIYKNFYNKKTVEQNILVFKFDNNDKILNFTNYDLNNFNNVKIINETTENNLIKKGLIENIFGGVGTNTLSNTP